MLYWLTNAGTDCAGEAKQPLMFESRPPDAPVASTLWPSVGEAGVEADEATPVRGTTFHALWFGP